MLVPLLLATTVASAQTPVTWSLAPIAAPIAPGDTAKAQLTAQIDPGWYIYALTQAPGGPYALEIVIPKNEPFAIAGRIDAPAPRRKFDENFKIETDTHDESATFVVPVRLAPDASGVSHTLRLAVTFQACNDRLCLPPREQVLTARVPSTRATSSPPPAPAPDPVIAPGVAGVPGVPGVPDLAMSSRTNTFSAYLGLAIAMGAVSLLTPCVFPMIPITVSYFTRKETGAPRRRREALTQAAIYGAGIVLTFTLVGLALAAVFGAAGLNRFAANPWVNLAIAGLFIVFALSLFGVYELAVPSRLLTAASRWESGRGRHAGTLLMGLAFTLTSFTCTAPFVGTLLVVAAQGDWQWPLAGMLAYATVFALPFVALALAPRWLSSLPRSGVWLIAVKAVMGLLELAAAMKFLSNVDLVWGWNLLTREVVLVIWMAIAMWLTAYLSGIAGVGRVPRLGRPGVRRAVAAVASAVMVVWLASGLGGRRLGELEAFLPPADLAATTPGGELPWIVNDLDAARAAVAATGRPMLIDFTGYTCTNCRWMEANMFPRPEVARELSRFVRVRLYTDGRGEMYRQFQNMQESLFGTVALPYYAVIAPRGQPLVGFGGLTRSSDEFVAFLRRGLE